MKRRHIILSVCVAGVLVVTWANLVIGPVRYEYVLANDFVGDITVLYHPKGPDKIQRTYFGKTTFRLDVPASGIVVTPDFSRLFYMANDEIWRYEDGRIIKSWPNILSHGFLFAGSTGGYRGSGVDKSNPLFRWAEWDSRSSYWKLTSTSYAVRKQEETEQDAASDR